MKDYPEVGLDFVCVFFLLRLLPPRHPEWGRPSAAPLVDSIEGAGEATNLAKTSANAFKYEIYNISATFKPSHIFPPVPPQLFKAGQS